MAYFKCKHYNPLFGDGSDGTKEITDAQIWNAPTEDTTIIEKKFINFTLGLSGSISAGNRNAGIIIRCTGDCIIHGTIRNAYASKSLLEDSEELAKVTALYPEYLVSTGAGGTGGNGGDNAYYGTRGDENSKGYGGSAQLGRFYGGGHGAGGAGGYAYAYNAGSGYGGNGGSTTETTVATDLFANAGATWCQPPSTSPYTLARNGANGGHGGGGAGGASAYGNGSNTRWAEGGAGGGGYARIDWPTYYNSTVRGAGGGGGCGGYGAGNILLFVQGNLIIDGTLNCNGSNGGGGGGGGTGGEAVRSKYGYTGSGAGGGGGGRIYLLSKGTITLDGGTFSVTGGSAGGGHTVGTAGGDGTKHYTTYADYLAGIAPTIIAS